VCDGCGKSPCGCPCDGCGHANGGCNCDVCGLCGSKTCSGEACKDNYNNDHPDGDLSFEEWLAMQRYHESKYGGTYEEFLEWLANYEGGYDEFVSIMKLTGYNDLPSLSEFILSIESTIDPINVLTGELYFTESDIAVPAPGLPLVFERFYASEDGWRNSFAWEFKAIRDKTLESRTVHVLGDYGSWAGLQTKIFTNSTTALDDLDHILLKTGEGLDYRFEMSDTEPSVFCAEAIDWKIIFEKW